MVRGDRLRPDQGGGHRGPRRHRPGARRHLPAHRRRCTGFLAAGAAARPTRRARLRPARVSTRIVHVFYRGPGSVRTAQAPQGPLSAQASAKSYPQGTCPEVWCRPGVTLAVRYCSVKFSPVRWLIIGIRLREWAFVRIGQCRRHLSYSLAVGFESLWGHAFLPLNTSFPESGNNWEQHTAPDGAAGAHGPGCRTVRARA